MNTIIQLIDPSITYALGWTIIHSLWQASLIALLMSVLHRFSHSKKATYRYTISVWSMVTVFVASVATFILYYSTPSGAAELLVNNQIAPLELAAVTETSTFGGLQEFFIRNIETINLIWGIGVIVFLVRFIFSYLYTKYLKHTALFSENSGLEKALARITEKLAIQRTVRIAESALVKVPLVIGHVKPIILFPVGIINMLSTSEVEAIITHELAHIKRYDYLTNIVLTLLEILFYFHPAVWWISANVKAERENCCDDYALSHDIDKVTYAKALVKLEEIKSLGAPALAIPFSSKKHQLMNRIKRIMNMPQTQNDIKEKSIATILLFSIILLFSYQANSEPAAQLDNADTEKETTETTTRIVGDEEMVLKVTKGNLESLTVDDKEVEEDVVTKIAEAIAKKNAKEESTFTITLKESPILEIINDEVKIMGQAGVYYESEDDFSSKQIMTDTVPKNKSDVTSMMIIENGKKIEVTQKNGEITALKIDDKVIPKSEYYKYEDEINANSRLYLSRDGDEHNADNRFYLFRDSDDIFKELNQDSLSKNFGLLFDGENWREFGGNIEQFLNGDVMEELRELENLRFNFEFLDDFEDIKGLRRLEDLDEWEDAKDVFEELEIEIDSSFGKMQLRLGNPDFHQRFHFFDGFGEDEVEIFTERGSDYKKGTVVDRMGKMLNKDGLLKEYKSNEIELTGKHLKINGEKMPNAIFEKYKNIYQESTGAPLTKKSKMIFSVDGKPSKRKVRNF